MHKIFDGTEKEAIDRVSEVFGVNFAASTALTAVSLARDNSISPPALAAGLCMAHIAGLAAAMKSGRVNGQLDLTVADVVNALLDLQGAPSK